MIANFYNNVAKEVQKNYIFIYLFPEIVVSFIVSSISIDIGVRISRNANS